MKQKRNSGIGTLFWATIIMLTILGLILTFFDISPKTFPEEDSSYTESSPLQITDITVVPEPNQNLETTSPQETTHPTEPPSVSDTLESNEATSQTESNTETTTEVEMEIEAEVTVEVETTDEPKTTVIPEETTKSTGTIYLTFDDGPSQAITPQILDILNENNVKATFFIVDYSIGSEREALVIRAFNEGHTIGLHGTSHTYSKIYSSLEALINNFETLQEKVYNSTGYQSNIIRFPGGTSNTVSKHYCQGIMTNAIEYFSSTDFLYFDWNVDSRDAGGATTAYEVFENVTSTIKPGRNNVVLMHDSGSKSHTLEALQSIIDWAISEGYEFKAITEETPQVVHKPAN